MRNLSFGNETNLLELLVEDVQLKPHAEVSRHNLSSGIKVKITSYNLENLLCQVLEDYGEERLIREINKLCDKVVPPTETNRRVYKGVVRTENPGEHREGEGGFFKVMELFDGDRVVAKSSRFHPEGNIIMHYNGVFYSEMGGVVMCRVNDILK